MYNFYVIIIIPASRHQRFQMGGYDSRRNNNINNNGESDAKEYKHTLLLEYQAFLCYIFLYSRTLFLWLNIIFFTTACIFCSMLSRQQANIPPSVYLKVALMVTAYCNSVYLLNIS